MKKLLLFATVFSALAIIGCSKKDFLPNSYNDNGVTPNESTESMSKELPYPGWGCWTWYDYTLDTCLLIRHSDIVCGIYLGCNQGDPMQIDSYLDEGGKIARIVIRNYLDLPDGSAEGFANLIEHGSVTIMYDAQITDPALLDLVSIDYIPAGTFPIYQEGPDAVIEIIY